LADIMHRREPVISTVKLPGDEAQKSLHFRHRTAFPYFAMMLQGYSRFPMEKSTAKVRRTRCRCHGPPHPRPRIAAQPRTRGRADEHRRVRGCDFLEFCAQRTPHQRCPQCKNITRKSFLAANEEFPSPKDVDRKSTIPPKAELVDEPTRDKIALQCLARSDVGSTRITLRRVLPEPSTWSSASGRVQDVRAVCVCRGQFPSLLRVHGRRADVKSACASPALET